MNGAECLVHTLLDSGIRLCFANPGTSEMHFVSALDRIEGMRCVLGLFEGIATGAADGYYRMTDEPAATLLHLGPGLANGLANLHNARKARSGIVNIVGDHATAHLAFDAPLTSDLPGVAAPMSHWVRTIASTDAVSTDGREAVAVARSLPGRIATLILPADKAWSNVQQPPARQGAIREPAGHALDRGAVDSAAALLRQQARSTLLLLGGRALRGAAREHAGRIAAATGCSLMSEFYVARSERGAGRVAIPRLPYSVDAALAALKPFRRIILVGAAAPVAFFAYPGKPGELWAPDCEFIALARPDQDPAEALNALCDAVDAASASPPRAGRPASQAAFEDVPLNPDSIGALLARLIPENAIVVDEAISTGRAFDAATQHAAPHDWLTGMGGAIGFGLPTAVGAAIGAPGRKVISLEADGSGMYTLQALWTMVRESLDITVVIFANRTYQILRGELANVGAGAPGPRATDMLTIGRPDIDWVALARGMGLEASRVASIGEFGRQMQRSLQLGGPSLIEVAL